MPTKHFLTDNDIIKTFVWYFSVLLGQTQDLASNTEYSNKLGQLIQSLSTDPYKLTFVCGVTAKKNHQAKARELELVGRGILDPLYSLIKSDQQNMEYADVLSSEYGDRGLRYLRDRNISCLELKKLLPYMALLVHQYAPLFWIQLFSSYRPGNEKKLFDAPKICFMTDAEREHILSKVFSGGHAFLEELKQLLVREAPHLIENQNYFHDRAQRFKKNINVIQTCPGLSDAFLKAMKAYALSGNMDAICQRIITAEAKSLPPVDCRAALILLPISMEPEGVTDAGPRYEVLSQLIDDMLKYAKKNHHEAIVTIAVQLKKELLLFAKKVEHSQDMKTQHLFSAKFIALLHSKDDSITQHKHPYFDAMRDGLKKLLNILKSTCCLQSRDTYKATLFGKTTREKKFIAIEKAFLSLPRI